MNEGVICGEQPRWSAKDESGKDYRVCDIHLAWAIRHAGLPALVDEHKPVLPPKSTLQFPAAG